MSESNKGTFNNHMTVLISAIKDYINILSNYYKNYKNVTVNIMNTEAYYGFVRAKDIAVSDLKKIRDKFPHMIKDIVNAIPSPKKPTFGQRVTSFFITQTQKPDESELQQLKSILTTITTNYVDSKNLWLTLVYTLTKVKFKHLEPAITLVDILKDYLDLEVLFVFLLHGFSKIVRDALSEVNDCETQYEQAKITANEEIQSKDYDLRKLKLEQKYYKFPLTVLQKIQKNQIPTLEEIKKICERYKHAADVLTMICVLKDKSDNIPSYNNEVYSLKNNKLELLNQLKKSRPKYSEKILTYAFNTAQCYLEPYLKKNDYLIYRGFEDDLIEHIKNYSDKLVASERESNISYLDKLGDKIQTTLDKICQNLNNIHTRKKLKSWENLFEAQNFSTLPSMMKKYYSSYHKLVEEYTNIDALALLSEITKKTEKVTKEYKNDSEHVQNQIKELNNQIAEISSRLRDAKQKYENARRTASEIKSRVESIVDVIEQLFCKSTRRFQ